MEHDDFSYLLMILEGSLPSCFLLSVLSVEVDEVLGCAVYRAFPPYPTLPSFIPPWALSASVLCVNVVKWPIGQ